MYFCLKNKIRFKKIIIGIFISTLFHSYLFADVLNLRNIYDVKIFSTAKLEINDTNLIDESHAEDLLENVKELKVALDEESKKITKKSKIVEHFLWRAK